MSDAALLALALVMCVAGMSLFALSIGAHWGQVTRRPPAPRPLRIGLRVMGTMLLASAFWLCALADPVSMAALVWPMLLTVAAALVAAALTLHARRSHRAGRG